MNKTDYWIEGLTSFFEEHGIVATPEQIALVAADVALGAENIDQAFYVPENPLIFEVDRLKKELKTEKAKVVCSVCHGNGRVTTFAGSWRCNSACDECHGEGYKLP